MARILIVAARRAGRAIDYAPDVPVVSRHLERHGYDTPAATTASALVRLAEADAVLAIGGVLEAAAARVLAGRVGVPYGVVYQRIECSSSRGAHAAGPFVSTTIAAWAARRAVATGIVAETFRRPLERAGVEPSRIRRLPLAVTGGFELGMDRRASPNVLGGDGEPAGVLLIGDGQGIRAWAAALKRRRDVRLIAAHPSAGGIAWTLGRAKQGGPTAREYVRAMAAADVIVLCQPADVALPPPPELPLCLASGRPIIVAAPAGSEVAREARDHSAALIALPADLCDVIACIDRLRADAGLRSYVTEAAQRWAAASFTMEGALAAYERFVTALLAEGGRAPVHSLITHANESAQRRSERRRAA